MDKKMTAEMIAQEVRTIMGEEMEVMLQEAKKNNGVTRQGVAVRKKGNAVAPLIYIDSMAEDVDAGKMSVEDAARKIAEMAEQAQDDVLETKAKNILDRDYILNNVGYRMVNAGRNREMLKELVHKTFEDLAALYEVRVTDGDSKRGTFLLKQNMLEKGNITAEELDEAARRNDIQRGFSVKPIGDALAAMVGMDDETASMIDPCMVVITNDQMVHGASAIMFEDTLKEATKYTGNDFYILPSSVHEILAVPAGIADEEELRTMVREVNNTQVAPEEILSYNVYRCDGTTGKVTVA